MTTSEEKKLFAPEIQNINSREDAIRFLASLKKQGVKVMHKYSRIMIPHETKEDFFVKSDGKLMITGYGTGGMGRGTAKNIGEKLTVLLNVKSKEDFDKIWNSLDG